MKKLLVLAIFFSLTSTLFGQQSYNARSIFFAGSGGTLGKDTSTYCMTSPCPVGTVIFGIDMNMYVRKTWGWRPIGGTLLAANNGLTVSSDTTQLGGTLIKDTHLDGAFNFNIGANTPLSGFSVTGSFMTLGDETTTSGLSINSAGNLSLNAPNTGINFATPLKAGGTGFTPLQLQSGSLTSPVQNGGFGYDGSHLYFGIGGTNYQLDQQSGTTPPGGSNTQIQYNNSGVFGATSDNVWKGTTKQLQISDGAHGRTNIGTISVGSGDQSIQLTDLDHSFQTTLTAGGGLFSSSNPISIGVQSSSAQIVFSTTNGVITITGIPTSCAGKPTGTLWNNSGVLSICP